VGEGRPATWTNQRVIELAKQGNRQAIEQVRLRELQFPGVRYVTGAGSPFERIISRAHERLMRPIIKGTGEEGVLRVGRGNAPATRTLSAREGGNVYSRQLEQRPRAMGELPGPPLAPDELARAESIAGMKLTDQQAKNVLRRELESKMAVAKDIDPIAEMRAAKAAPTITTDSMGIRWAEGPGGVRVSIPKHIPDSEAVAYAQQKLVEQAAAQSRIKGSY
jgi:hypothetical protein